VRFLRFWWDFVIGDVWLAAAGVAVALGVTAALGAWWVLPVGVAAVLAASLVRATRRAA
jgi:hypothetical protein